LIESLFRIEIDIVMPVNMGFVVCLFYFN